LRPRRFYSTVGGVTFLFWTRLPAGADDIVQLESPQPEQVARLIESADVGRPAYGVDANDFYCLSLSGNAARAIVRDYLEAPLPEIQTSLGRWFRDLRIIDEWTGQPTAIFPLWRLAVATVRDADDVPPDLPVVLLSAALKGKPVPGHVLAACLRRIGVETGSRRFPAERMGLIKLVLDRLYQGDLKMSEHLDAAEAANQSQQ
jgi:CRISPR-associated protein Csd1